MVRYGIGIRMLPNEQSSREFLHEDYSATYSFKEPEQAENALMEAVTQLASDMETTFTVGVHYERKDGGGFWFEFGDGTEGRAIVTEAHFEE